MRLLEWIDEERRDSEAIGDAPILEGLIGDGHRVVRLVAGGADVDPSASTTPESAALRRLAWRSPSRWSESAAIREVCLAIEGRGLDAVWARGRDIWSPAIAIAARCSVPIWLEIGSAEEAAAARTLRGLADFVVTVPCPSFATLLPARVRGHLLSVERRDAGSDSGRVPLAVPPPLLLASHATGARGARRERRLDFAASACGDSARRHGAEATASGPRSGAGLARADRDGRDASLRALSRGACRRTRADAATARVARTRRSRDAAAPALAVPWGARGRGDSGLARAAGPARAEPDRGDGAREPVRGRLGAGVAWMVRRWPGWATARRPIRSFPVGGLAAGRDLGTDRRPNARRSPPLARPRRAVGGRSQRAASPRGPASGAILRFSRCHRRLSRHRRSAPSRTLTEG